MARANWLNEDGLKVTYGPVTGTNPDAGAVHTKGLVKELVVVVDATDLPTTGAAVELNNYSIPAGAVILEAGFTCTETFDTAVEFGTMNELGANIDKDGLIATVTPTANSYYAGAGAQVGTVAGVDMYITVRDTAGAPTTGKGQFVVRYEV